MKAEGKAVLLLFLLGAGIGAVAVIWYPNSTVAQWLGNIWLALVNEFEVLNPNYSPQQANAMGAANANTASILTQAGMAGANAAQLVQDAVHASPLNTGAAQPADILGMYGPPTPLPTSDPNVPLSGYDFSSAFGGGD